MKYSFEEGVVELVYSYIAMADIIIFIKTISNYFPVVIKVVRINPKDEHQKKEKNNIYKNVYCEMFFYICIGA